MNAAGPSRKWRPTLGMIVFAMLATVAALPFAALLVFRLFDNELLRQTESELIAQSAVLSAVIVAELDRAAGGPLPVDTRRSSPAERFHPVRPTLDVASNRLAPPRPDAAPADTEPDPGLAGIGSYVSRLTHETQSITLAGLRVLDGKGVVIAGGGELGLSLAHVAEVRNAMEGHYVSVIRRRSTSPPGRLLPWLRRGSHLRVFTALPVHVEGRVAAVIYASRTPANLAAFFYGERWALLMSALTVLTGTALTGYVLLRTINRPIHRLLERTISLGNGDRRALRPLAHYGTREIAALSQGILTSARKLFDRSDFLATFIAHLSHEFKSPLTSIRGAAEILRDGDMPAAEKHRFLGNIEKDADRLSTLVGRLRELARADNPIPGGRTTAADAMAAIAENKTGAVILTGDVSQPVPMSCENAAIVLSHLIDNALQHHARTIGIDVGRQEGSTRITVSDDGDGISENNRCRIFDAFFTTKREVGGTGMGLAIVRSMVEAHGGSIDLLPTPSGCRFLIVLPS